ADISAPTSDLHNGLDLRLYDPLIRRFNDCAGSSYLNGGDYRWHFDTNNSGRGGMSEHGLDYDVASGPQSRIQQRRACGPRERAQENRAWTAASQALRARRMTDTFLRTQKILTSAQRVSCCGSLRRR